MNTAADLFTEGAHHRNISIIFIIQKLFFQGKQSRTIGVNAHYFILLKNPRDRQQVEVFGRQVYPRKSYIFSEAYERATMRPYDYLVVDLYPVTSDSCRLRTDIFPGENNPIRPNVVVPIISAITDSFKKKNYTASAELQAVHNSKKQMDTLMACLDLPSEIKAQEIGKAQDRHLLFRKRLKSNQSFKSKSILEPKRRFSPESLISVADNIEPHDMSLDVGPLSE